jgi:hypothetical protein
MGPTGNNPTPGQHWHDKQKYYQHTNEVNRDHARSDTRAKEYSDIDDQTDDSKFEEGKPQEKMDFRDKSNNLEAES